MKKTFWMITAGLSLILAACGGSPPAILAVSTPTQYVPPPIETLPPDIVIASAEARPARESYVAFAISAPIKEIFVKEGDAVKAGQELMTLYVPDLEGEVVAMEFAVQSAELEYQYWIPPRLNRPPERKQKALAEFDQVKTQLEVAKANLAQKSIYAPFDATVVDVSMQRGEIAQTGKVVITLADLAHLQIVTTDLSERDVPRVEAGQSVSVYLEAMDQTVDGKVLRVSPVSETVGGDVTYPVTIELDKQVEDLLWGMTAEVEIQTK